MVLFALFALAGFGLLPLLTRGLGRRERQIAWVSLGAHLGASLAQYWVTRYYYGGGDMLAYHRHGAQLSWLMSQNLGVYGPEVVRLALSMDAPALRYTEVGVFAGTSTGAMFGIGGLLHFCLGGSLLGACGLLTVGSFASKMLLFRTARSRFEARVHVPMIAAILLVPSVVYWSSGLLKETVAMIGLGPLLMALDHLQRGKRRSGGVLLLVGAGLILLSKAYILSAAAAALSAAAMVALARRRGGGVKPGQAFIGLLAMLIGIVVVGRLLPRYSITEIGSELARLQTVGMQTYGGSNYALGFDPSNSLLLQLGSAPIALVTTLYRPFPFEVQNALMAASALENVVLLALTVRAFWPGRRPIRRILESPLLVAIAAYVMLFGVVVGLASTNLGALSRYRIPLVPFLGILLVVLPSRVRPSARPRRPPRFPRRPLLRSPR
ncbi:MAG: hypothetical protein AB8I08_31735 [Sandaracinaceae bacterium]